MGQERATVEELEARLATVAGVERVRVLAELTERLRSTAPARAVGYAESAMAVAASHPDALAEVRALTEGAWALMELGRYDEARARAEEGLARARGAQVRRGEARAVNNLGVIARLTGDFPEALTRFREALDIYRDIGDDAAVATSLNNLSVVLGFDIGDFQRAVDYQLQALAIRERIGDEEGRYQSYNSLGVIYDGLGDEDRAVQYLDQALAGWRKLGLQPRIAATLNNLSGVYAEQGHRERALEAQRQALAIREELGSRSGIAYSLASIGTILADMGRLEEARPNLEQSLALRRELGERKTEAQSLLALARLARLEGRHAVAAERLDEALAIAREVSAAEEERDVFRELAALREARGDHRGALSAFRTFDELDNALFGAERARRIEMLEAEFRKTQAQQEIERLAAQAELSSSLAQQRRTQMLLVLSGALLAFLLYRRHVTVRTRKDLERQVAERTAELSEANTRLKALSLTDTLTGLPNRRYFFQTIESDVAIAARAHRAARQEGTVAEGSDVVFYVLDLDDFKSVNDGYGHAAGDLVLQQVAGVLKETGRASDLVVRWGGEEFLIVSRHVDRKGSAAFAERIRQAVRNHMFAAGDGRMLHRTCSVGFVAFPFVPADPDGVHWDTVLGLADQAAYAAKRGGRDGWVGLAATGATLPAEVGAAREAVAELVRGGALSCVASVGTLETDVWVDDDGSRIRTRARD